jgi:hypothetical protein
VVVVQKRTKQLPKKKKQFPEQQRERHAHHHNGWLKHPRSALHFRPMFHGRGRACQSEGLHAGKPHFFSFLARLAACNPVSLPQQRHQSPLPAACCLQTATCPFRRRLRASEVQSTSQSVNESLEELMCVRKAVISR